MFSELSSFQDFQPYGELLSRAAGLGLTELMPLLNKINEGRKTGDYSQAGKAFGRLFMLTFDTAL